MRIAEVIGTVTLSQWHPSLGGASWRVAVPLDHVALAGDPGGRGEPFVVYDELGSRAGSQIAVSEGAEASAPFHPDSKPIDAYCSAILDTIEVDPLPSTDS